MIAENRIEPPQFLELAAHRLRWGLLRELARSDRHVRELMVRVGAPQSLVSYHLARLRRAGVVTARRSSADGRDSYYRLELPRCAELLGATGAALHPGLADGRDPRPPEGVWGRVLFLCTGNSARSQMAEAFLQHYTDNAVEALSAGSQPTRLHPNAVQVMGSYGIDLSGRRAKHFSEFMAEPFDCVVTLCDRVREVCPEFPGSGEAIHWSMANPAEEGDSDEASFPAFERTAVELASRIPFLVPLLHAKHDRNPQEVT
jgi:ArsR family transcriptional regulator, arsenate/arsenite/antimonite-responsive transcriptional repressor / arsenate reductase (thioredoxin)